MVRNRNVVSLLLCCSVLLFAGCFPIPFSPEWKMTREYGLELQAVYGNYTDAVATAYETGDTSQLQDTATGHELEYRMETTGTANAMATAEWWKKLEVVRVIVTEYSMNTARAFVEERDAQFSNTDRDDKFVMIVEFQRVDGKWKVSEVAPYPFD